MISLLLSVELDPSLAPGYRDFCAALAGERAGDRASWLRNLGITRTAAWQSSAGGSHHAVMLFEGDDPLASLQTATADSEFGGWFLAGLDQLLPAGPTWSDRLASVTHPPLLDTSASRHQWRSTGGTSF